MKRYNIFSRRIIFAYIKSMRFYLFFISGMAGFLGIIFVGEIFQIGRFITVLSVLLLGWGVNQVINDLVGLKEDRINAPHRPLVTGELPVLAAVVLSLLLFILGAIVTFILNTKALILYVVVFFINIGYEYSKKVPLLGNIVFGILLVPCLYYSAMCVHNTGLEILLDKKLFLLAVAVLLINITLVFFTYYKDFPGDKVAGKKTLIVRLTPQKARYLNWFVSAFPFILLPFVCILPGWKNSVNPYFIGFMLLSFGILQYTASLFFKYPEGINTYYSLKWNFRGAVLYKTSLIALINPFLAGILYLINFIFLGVMFDLHRDHLA